MIKLILVLILSVGLLTSCPQTNTETATADTYQSAYSPAPAPAVTVTRKGGKKAPTPPATGELLATSDDKSSNPNYYQMVKNLKTGHLGPVGNGTLSVGSPAPDFNFAINGEVSSISQLRGKPIMINIFASWCPPCKSEMPDIQRAYENHKSKGLVIVAVSTDDGMSEAKSFYNQFNLTLPFVPGGEPGMAIGSLYKVQYIPTSIFVNRKGNVVEFMSGGLDPSALEEKLAKIL